MMTKKQIEAKGYKVTFTNGTGAGGQKRNRTLSVAVVTHESGLTERCDETRSANKNMNIAFNNLEKRLEENKIHKYEQKLNEERNKALSKGVIRTYDYKRGVVKDHQTKKEAPLNKVLNGKLNLLK